ncbi:MAG: hypothetical protein IPK78_12640 [Rhodospirillales bacterium]|nr:hypothetical protein [Rhodospirillales bacterium]
MQTVMFMKALMVMAVAATVLWTSSDKPVRVRQRTPGRKSPQYGADHQS